MLRKEKKLKQSIFQQLMEKQLKDLLKIGIVLQHRQSKLLTCGLVTDLKSKSGNKKNNQSLRRKNLHKLYQEDSENLINFFKDKTNQQWECG